MSASSLPEFPTPFSRRELLGRAGYGLGAVALGRILSGDGVAAATLKARSGLHFPARTKRVISLFQSGAPSQVDLFDYKPLLNERLGEDLPESVRRASELYCCHLL